MKKNSDNTRRGREFQELAASVLGQYWGVTFDLEIPFAIGDPPKQHKFDMVSTDREFVGEAKNFTWTVSGKTPSAKMAFVNQAVFYLSHLPRSITRFVVMPRDIRQKTEEALADYYYRTYRHLLNGVLIIEIDPATESIRQVGNATSDYPD